MKKLIALFLTLSIVLSAFGVSTILPVMAETSPVKLQIDFEGRNAENKVEGFGDGQIVGSPTFVESYDGSVALHIENDFSKTAVISHLRTFSCHPPPSRCLDCGNMHISLDIPVQRQHNVRQVRQPFQSFPKNEFFRS